jgi:outer membrane protein TolC
MSWSGDGGRQRTAADVLSGAPRGVNREHVAALLASAYVHARVLRIRMATAQAIVMNARRQSERLSKQSTGASGYETDAQQHAAAMAARAQTAAADFDATFTRRLAEIAELTGMELVQTRAILEPSLSASQLPVFGVAVPWRLPGQVLRGRADVQSVEMSLRREHPGGQLRVDEFATTLDGWIEPNGEMSAKDEERDTVARAKAEVGAALYRLIRQQQAASMAYQISQLRSTEFDAVLRRQELGEVADGEVLEKHLLLLVESDRLAAAVGAIADAWIALNAATGGLAAVAASGPATSPHGQSGSSAP